ncbi:MAG: type I asparaginase [Bacteroidales bacterium]|nr:type I asparaginase [Bacteroidales bacterium]MEE3463897.1 type I asparaginase [Candidatus Cryptobacteroides sp.]MBO7366823.1 type I asparaginase [Bacteroidales bacterium]MBO7623453.1 type I asparaginase [Bacteroidales bacterium]MBP5235063.1 type I asparaginase [Bacteroidales bacterium]
MNNRSSLLMIYTGGTIGMKQDATDQTLKPFDFGQILNEVPEIRKFAFKIDTYTFDPLIDSSDVEPALWVNLAQLIRDRYDLYDGFIILHGTDTMAYSASALSFMMDGLTKPVIFTGSQLPIGVPRTDGKENLISAVEIASAKDSEGHALVPEVCIYFNSLLMRGNRCTKTDAEAFRAFRSPNCDPLAEAGINIRYDSSLIRKPLDWYQSLSISTNLDTRVSILKVHPGITPQLVRTVMCDPETRAVIMETYGSGNAPTKQWFLDIIRESCESGKVVVNVTQCQAGTVNMNLYATGKALKDAGVLNGYDCTTESCLAKLFYLMGKSPDNEWVKGMMERNLKGEISK